MGINDEYSRDAYNYDLAYDSDGSDGAANDVHPEDWQDLHSQELLDAWMRIREYTDARYVNIQGGYPKFVDLVLSASSWVGPVVPSQDDVNMWNSIKDMAIIRGRVEPDNFFAWSHNYIGQM